jgi:hypothetical protein
MKEKKQEIEKIKYEVFTLRLHKGTKVKFIEERKRSGLSWNRFVYKLLESKAIGK